MLYPEGRLRHVLSLPWLLLTAGFIQAQVQPLTPGQMIEAKIQGGDSHTYSITVSRGQFLRLTLEEKRLDQGLEIYRDKELLAKSQRHRAWKETLSYEVPATGNLHVVVTTAKIKLDGSYRLSLAISPRASDADRQRQKAESISQQAFDLAETRKPANAPTYLQLATDAQRMWGELGDSDEKAYALLLAARANRALGQHDKSLALGQEALALFSATKNLAGQGAALRTSAIANIMMARTADAIRDFEKVVPAVQAAGDVQGEAEAFSDLGTTYVNTGKHEDAIAILKKSVALSRQLKDKTNEATALSNLGYLTCMLRQYEECGSYGEQAVRVFQEIDKPDLESGALLNVAAASLGMGDFRKAVEANRRSLEIRRRLNDPSGIITSLAYLADTYQQMGRYDEALAALDEEEALRATTSYHVNEYYHFGVRAKILSLTNRLDQAIGAYQRVVEISRTAGEPDHEAEGYAGLADVYAQLGQDDRALEYAQRALAIYSKLGNNAVMDPLQVIGDTYARRGDLVKARSSLEEMLNVARRAKRKSQESAALIELGRVEAAVPDVRAARQRLEAGLAIAREGDDPNLQAMSLSELGALNIQEKKPKEAREVLEQALAIYRQLGSEPDQSNVLYALAKVERLEDHLPAAKALLEQSLSLAESLRNRLFNPASRLTWLSTVQATSRLYVDTLMALHRSQPARGYDVLAFEASERARARSLLDQLVETRTGLDANVDPVAAARELRLGRQLDALEAQRLRLLTERHDSAAKSLASEITDIRAQLEQTRADIRSANQGRSVERRSAPLAMARIQQNLDRDTVLLEYMLGPQRSYLWLLDQSALRSIELPPVEAIESAARRVYDLVTARGRAERLETTPASNRVANADRELASAVDSLSRMVLQPAGDALGSKRLIVVSDGALDYVPFAMLSAGQAKTPEPLVLQHEIVALPSASALVVHRQELAGRASAPQVAAIFADPVFSQDDQRIAGKVTPKPTVGTELRLLEHLSAEAGSDSGKRLNIPRLPFTRREAAEIASLVPADQRMEALGFDASRATALSDQLGRYRYVHFATHGWLDSERPDQSAIVLSLFDAKGNSVDGFLRTDDVYKMKLNAELVTLSACQTGLGKRIEGEGVVGLTRAFLYAGAARVLVSDWSVSDEGTQWLMRDFYRSVLQKGQTPSAALRTAQIRMLRQKKWQSPYYWAAFALHGEWR